MTETTNIPIYLIYTLGWNPRKTFDESGLNELANSISQHGILEPLIVRKNEEGYDLVVGERRFRAAKVLGLKEVPAVVKDLTDQQVREIMLLENLQREDLTPLEEAEALQQLLQHEGMTQQALAQRIGKSQPWIANRLRLLDTPEDLKPHLISREISPKHMVILFRYKQYGPLFRFLTRKLKEKIEKEGQISVKELEESIYHWINYDAENQDLVFDLNPYSWEQPEWWDHFDLSECKTCEHRFEKDKGLDTVCLNRSCFKNKANIAKQKYEKELETLKEKTAVSEDNAIDTSKLSYGEYEIFKYHHTIFDIETCSGCEFLKIDKDGDPLCLNPKCFKKKMNTHARYMGMIRRQEEEEVLNTLYNYLSIALNNGELQISPVISKALLEHFIDIAYSDDDMKAFHRYGIKKWSEANKVWDHITGDLSLNVTALAVLFTRKMVGRYKSGGRDKLSYEDLERVLPAAAEEMTRELHLEAKEGKITATIDITPDTYFFTFASEEGRPTLHEDKHVNRTAALNVAKEYFTNTLSEGEGTPLKRHILLKNKILGLIHAALEVERLREENKE